MFSVWEISLSIAGTLKKKRNQQFRILYLKFNDYVQASFICLGYKMKDIV